MPKKIRVFVDLPPQIYEAIKEAAGSAESIPHFIYKEMRDTMRARVNAHMRKSSDVQCPPNCRTVTRQVNHEFCQPCRNLYGP